MFRYDGQSGGVTPGPIPNPAVKPARVPVCTVLRKRTGTQARCQPLFHFYYVAERLFILTDRSDTTVSDSINPQLFRNPIGIFYQRTNAINHISPITDESKTGESE